MRLNCLALAQGAKKALKHVNGVLLKPPGGAFGKSVRRKLKKIVFFGDRKHFFRRSVCQGGARLGQKQKKRDAKDRGSRAMSFTQGEARFMAKLNLNTRNCAVKSLARRVTTRESRSGWYAFSCSRKQNHHFLDQKPGVLRSGGKWHVLGWPTIIIIKKF